MRNLRFLGVLCCLVAGLLVATTAQATTWGKHTIRKGEWLSQIAEQYNTTVESLMIINDDIKDKDRIYEGDILTVPVDEEKEKPDIPAENTVSRDRQVKRDVQAETYTVRKGDTLSKISRKFGVSLKKLIRANSAVEDPDLIYPGWELRIPDSGGSESGVFHWKNVGVDPFTTNPEDPEQLKKGLRLLGFSQEQIFDISLEMRDAEPEISSFKKGDRLEAMVFGESRVEKPVICAFEEEQPTKAYTTSTLEKLGYILVVPEVCGNYSLISAPKKEEPSAKVEGLPSTEERPSFSEVPTHPGKRDKKRLERTKFEAYMGGGVDEPVHASGHNEHAWGKVRYRPFWAELTDSIDIGFGIFGYGAIGSGRDGSYRHSWKRFSVGPNVKFVGENWDTDFDLGIGALSSDGEEGRYESDQRDKIYHLSVYSSFYKRRNEGEKWWPETNIGLDATIPYDTDHDHSWDGRSLEPDPWDNQVVELSLKQGIYDFDVGGNIRLTPEIHAGLGHSWGEEADFYKIGPGMSAGYKGYDILTLSVLNYQEYLGSDADNWSWASLTLDLTNTYKAWKASRIKKVN